VPTYNDLPYDLVRDEFNDVDLLEDLDSIRQSIRTIVLTKIGTRTRYQNPLFGSGVADLLFEKINVFTLSRVDEEISLAISNWEPRVSVIAVDVDINPDRNELTVQINFRVINLDITDTITINLAVLV
jgi:phage baseplate assembly protein W